jgi:hypothetical protein
MERLKALGFRALRKYTMLSEIKPGSIVIYTAQTLEEIRKLKDFIEHEEIQEEQFAFIIYTSSRIDGADLIYEAFDNVTFANSSVTMATHIYALARGLLT